MKIVSVAQMQTIEESADTKGLSYDAMMHQAGAGVAVWVAENLPLESGVVGLVGSGNNGGDTLIALQHLSKLGARTVAFLAKDRGEDRLITDYLDQGGQVVDISQKMHLALLTAALQPGTIILDGILGTGLRLPLRGVLQEVMAEIYQAVNKRSGGLVVAVDCPSGMDCDTGEVSEVTLRAAHTLCMAAIKQGLLKHPARDYVGRLHWIDIGITDIREHLPKALPELVDAEWVRHFLPDRPSSGHKGTFGTCQVIAGTEAFTGAAFLTGKAAYRAGCGLVDIATLSCVQNSLAGTLVEAVWTVLPELSGGYAPQGAEMLKQGLHKKDSLVLGPGFGLAESTQGFLRQLVQNIPDSCPVLIDADGLKLLSRLDRWWEKLPEEVILTPHPGEMAVLTGLSVDEIQTNRWGIASQYAQKWEVTVILKGAVTVIATAKGGLFINSVSDPSLATAGSGDVLSGLIGGLLAQGGSSEGASLAGVWLHSQAGLAAKQALGTDRSVTALDILNEIPTVFRNVTQ